MSATPDLQERGLQQLGWGPHFDAQLSAEEQEHLPARVAEVQRSLARLWSSDGALEFDYREQPHIPALAVGDWLLFDRARRLPLRLLERRTLLRRKAAGSEVAEQLLAANLDTLFVVSSCNAEFNLSRIERYLVLAAEGGIRAVVVLTKADQSDNPENYRVQAQALQEGLAVELVNAKSAETLGVLERWCVSGETIALLGSSGVGKSTLTNALADAAQLTQASRVDDDKGRHTTTARSLHRLRAGGLLIDNPGIRELQLTEVASGIEQVFSDLVPLLSQCRFRDCKHEREPGCAVQAALSDGRLTLRRWQSYLKLAEEQARNAESLAERRAKEREFGRHCRSVMAAKQRGRKARSRG